jgi:hypothetical protein
MTDQTQETEKLTEEQLRTAIRSPEHLRRWVLQEAPFVVFKGTDMVDALPYPSGHEAFQHFVSAYRSQRIDIEDDEQVRRRGVDPISRETLEVPGKKHDMLTVDEFADLVRWVSLAAGRVAVQKIDAELETQKKARAPAAVKDLAEAKTEALGRIETVQKRAVLLASELVGLHDLLDRTMRHLDE